eukprot:5635055-Amphidinium_carterae.1
MAEKNWGLGDLVVRLRYVTHDESGRFVGCFLCLDPDIVRCRTPRQNHESSRFGYSSCHYMENHRESRNAELG